MTKSSSLLVWMGVPVLATSLAACAGDEPFEAEARTRCISPEGVEERVSFAVLNAQIAANPDLPPLTGVARVETCEQAYAHVLAAREVIEAGAPSEPADLGADGVEPTIERTAYVKGAHHEDGARGLVGIYKGMDFQCTGWLLNSKVLVTAAHCLPNDSGTTTDRISYFDEGIGGQRNISNGHESLAYRAHPGWSGIDGDAVKDIGIIVRPAGWIGTDSHDFLRIFDDSLAFVGDIQLWGAGYDTFSGTGLGDLEWVDKDIEWRGDEHYFMIGKGVRICKGDSGGPAIRWLDGVIPAVTGVHSSIDVSSKTSKCAKKNGRMRDTRFTPSNIGWLREAAGDVLNTGPIPCSKHIAENFHYWFCS